jgi:hypothetical protein
MTLLEFIANIGNFADFSRRSKVLLFAYYLRKHQGIVEFAGGDVRHCFKDSLLKVPSDLSRILQSLARGRNSPLMKGGRTSRYSLAMPGLNEVETYLTTKQTTEVEVDAFLKSGIPYLEKVISKVSDTNQQRFLAESIACLGVDAKRATILMTWAATVAHIYDYILAHKLKEFNAALAQRTDKYGKLTINAYDDFAEIPESVFIEVCRSAKIMTNDVRKILDEKLGIRNTCAHPSGVEVHRTKVVNFIEDLVDNVITKYKI